MFFDPLYFLFAAPAILLMLYAQHKVSRTYSQYSKVINMQGLTGAQVARRLLQSQGLEGVGLEMTPGHLSDHYDPRHKVLRLSEEVYRSASVASMGIVAHEVGHAAQDKAGYAPMVVRSVLVPVANLGSMLGYIFFIIGLMLQLAAFTWLGIIFFSAAVVFALVTLPVELNASSRALAMLRGHGLVTVTEHNAANAVLQAAALTYLAALLQAVMNLLYFVFMALGMRRRD